MAVFFLLMPPPPPSAAAVALKGLFSQSYGRYKLTDKMVTALVAFFDGRGEAVLDLNLSCEASDMPSFEAEWRAYLVDAGNNSTGDGIRLVGWLKARMAAPGGTGAAADRAAGTAGVVVNALEELGHP